MGEEGFGKQKSNQGHSFFFDQNKTCLRLRRKAAGRECWVSTECLTVPWRGTLNEEGSDGKPHAPSCRLRVSEKSGDRVAGTNRSPRSVGSIH